ncbi:hypothetical protein F5Y13DRAFT_205902 [Hypoxylon sp. FL1857]|nr:hypothetical protein F5Y13DRAFT_205902 [Hypoxylon sp. FL1857]
MIPSYSPPGVVRLLVAAILFCCLLTAVSLHNDTSSPNYERRSLSTESNVSSKQPPIHNARQQVREGKNGINLEGVSDITPSAAATIISSAEPSLDTGLSSNSNSSVLTMSSSSVESSGGVPFLITDQPIFSFTFQSMPTSSTLTSTVGKIEDPLDGIDTLLVSRTIREVTLQARTVTASLQARASNVVSAEDRVEAGKSQALQALNTVEGLFENLVSAVDSIIQDVTEDAASNISAPAPNEPTKAVSSSFSNIVEVTGGVSSLVGNPTDDDGWLVEDASITPAASETTIFPVATTSAPVATAATSPPEVPTAIPSSHVSHSIVTTQSPVGSISKGTVVGPTAPEDCPSTVTSTVFLAGETSTTTVYASKPCPTIPPCPTCPSPTCHCPKAPPTTTTSPPGGNGAQGPCPGSGYTCHECIDGWFCPPPQTPAQPAPCGFGWPCVHCDGGWFCVPDPTPPPPADTCEGTGPTTNSPGSISSTTSPSETTSRPSSTQSAVAGIPKSPGGASGWGYCGCWADQADHRILNMESPPPNLGPLTNEDCVRHCLGRGFLMAGTENGSDCYCGNFLNGTQHLDDDVCSTPCTGDPSQACGGNNALTCYSSDNEAHGWASTGPQPLPATVSPPEVMSMVIGGVAQTVATEPAFVFPPPGADMSQLISQYGKKTQQPEGQMPSGMGTNSAPNGNGGPTPGSPTSSDTCVSGDLGDSTAPGSNTNGGSGASPTTPGGNPATSPNGKTSPGSNGSGVANSGASPSSGPAGNNGPTPAQSNGASLAPNGGTGANPATGNGNGGAGSVTPGGNSNLPTSPSDGSGASPTGPDEQGQTATSAPNGGNSGGQTQPSSGQGQGTEALTPNGNTSGSGGNPEQTSLDQGQGTATPNPTGNPSGNGGSTGQPSSGQGQGTTNPSNNGGNSGQTSIGEGQGTAAPNPSGNPSQASPGQSQGQGRGTVAPTGNGVSPSQTPPGEGEGTAGPSPTANLPSSGGRRSTCTPGSNDPACNSSGNGGDGGSGAPGTVQASTPPNGSGGEGSNLVPTNNPGPSLPNNSGGIATGQGQQPTASNNNEGGSGPNPTDVNPQTPGFTFPPGAVPYGNRPSPSMTTLKSMIAWTEPDGKEGLATVLLQHGMSSHEVFLNTSELEFEESSTTAATSMLADPRWQRIRPVVVW